MVWYGMKCNIMDQFYRGNWVVGARTLFTYRDLRCLQPFITYRLPHPGTRWIPSIFGVSCPSTYKFLRGSAFCHVEYSDRRSSTSLSRVARRSTQYCHPSSTIAIYPIYFLFSYPCVPPARLILPFMGLSISKFLP